jgi:hypothetical protein
MAGFIFAFEQVPDKLGDAEYNDAGKYTLEEYRFYKKEAVSRRMVAKEDVHSQYLKNRSGLLFSFIVYIITIIIDLSTKKVNFFGKIWEISLLAG